MIIYNTTCPIHNTTLTTTDIVKVKSGTSVTSRPIFFCPTCKRYYLYSKDKHTNPEKTKMEYKDLPVYYTSNVYSLYKEGDKPKANRSNNVVQFGKVSRERIYSLKEGRRFNRVPM